MEPTKHQYDYDSATIHGFLVRNGLEDEYRLNIEANHATLAGHSFHHEVAYAVANGILGSIDANRGDPQNGWDTDQFPNSVEDLALPIYEILRGGGLTTGGFNFDAKLRRQSTDRTDLFHAHVGGIDTLARALLVAADLVERETLVEAPGGALRGLERARSERRSSRARDPRLARGQGRVRRDRPEAGVRWPGAARERGEPGASGARTAARASGPPPRAEPRADVAFVLGIDVSTTATKAVLIDETGAVRGNRRRRVRLRGPAAALERAGSRPLVGRRDRRDPVRPGVDGRARVGGRRDRADGPDARARAAGRPRPVLRPGDPLERPADRRRCDAIRAAVGPERLIAITGNDALTGFTAPKLVWVRDHEPESGGRSPTCCCRRTTSASCSPATTRSTSPTAPGRSCSTWPRRTWSDEVVDALRIDRAWLPEVFEGPAVTGTITACGRGGDRAPSRHAGHRRRRRPGGECRRPRGGRRGHASALPGHVRRDLRPDALARSSSRTAGSMPSATPCRDAGT